MSQPTSFRDSRVGRIDAERSFREHEEQWRETIDRHGLSWLGATHQLAMGQVETSVGYPEQGEQRLREARATSTMPGKTLAYSSPAMRSTS